MVVPIHELAGAVQQMAAPHTLWTPQIYGTTTFTTLQSIQSGSVAAHYEIVQ